MSYPFDLERALKGEAVVTRTKHLVTHITRSQIHVDSFPLQAFVGGRLDYWTEEGKYLLFSNSSFDLFMLNPSTDADNS